MFRVSQHPSSGVLKTVTAASSTGHNTITATSLQRCLIGTDLCKSHATRTNQISRSDQRSYINARPHASGAVSEILESMDGKCFPSPVQS